MRILILVTCLVCLRFGLSNAQNHQPFQSALKHYEEKHDLRFSYDPAFIELIDRSFDIDVDLDTFINEVKSSLPFKIQMISEGYYTIAITKSEFKLDLTDSLAATGISPPFFFLINGDPVNMAMQNNVAIFSYKPVLSDTVIVYAPGYEKKLIPVKYLINQKVLQIPLMTQTYLLKDVLIEDYVTKGINMDPASQKIAIQVSDLPLLPGETDGDIFASLAALPGVSTPDGRPGNLFIRGSSVDQSLILFDNIPIYHRGHYFGTISPYNPKIVDEVEVYRSGYHPRVGGRVGGAVFINSDSQLKNMPQYGVGMNMLYGTAFGKTRLSNDKIGFTFGARRSYPRSIRSTKLVAISESVFSATGLQDSNGNLITDPEVLFQDYHTKLIFKPGDKHEVSMTGIYSNSDLVYDAPDMNGTSNKERIEFTNYGVNAEWNYRLSSHWSLTWINTASEYAFDNLNLSSSDGFYSINELQDINSRLEMSKSASQNHALQIGIDYQRQSTILDYRNIDEQAQAPYEVYQKQTANIISPFGNLEWNVNKRWFLQLGLRGTYYAPKSSFQWSPRANTNYDLNSWLTVKASAGLYHQYLSQVKNLEFGTGGFDNELWMLAGETSGSIISGEQVMTGALINGDNWLIDIEGYYKTANNITFYEDRRFNDRSTYFTGDDLLYGIDAYFKRDVGESGSAWIGYSYGNSKIKLDTTEQTTYKSKYVQPHNIYLGYAYQKNRWKFSTVFKYGSGLNAKSLDIAYAEVIFLRARGNRNPPPPPDAPPPPNPFVDVPERYSSIWSVDLSASYKIPKTEERKWSASFGASVINLFDRTNLIDRAFRGNPPPPEFIDRIALGFAPNIMVMIEW